MHLFGVAALDKFRTRHHEFPQYFASIITTPHFQSFSNHLRQVRNKNFQVYLCIFIIIFRLHLAWRCRCLYVIWVRAIPNLQNCGQNHCISQSCRSERLNSSVMPWEGSSRMFNIGQQTRYGALNGINSAISASCHSCLILQSTHLQCNT